MVVYLGCYEREAIQHADRGWIDETKSDYDHVITSHANFGTHWRLARKIPLGKV